MIDFDNDVRKEKFPNQHYNNFVLQICNKYIMVIIPSGFSTDV
jgi:hypothetical protein